MVRRSISLSVDQHRLAWLRGKGNGFRMSLLWRSWIAFVAVIATVLTVLAVLSVLQHNSILARVVQERLSVIAQTTASSFRSVVNLGLPLSMVRNAKDVLERSRNIDASVEAIHVFNPSGIVVHSTGSGDLERVSDEVLLAQTLSTKNEWSVQNEKQLLSGFSITNSAGNLVGGVLAVSSNRDLTAKSNKMAVRATIATAILLFVFSILSYLVLRLKLGGAIRGLARLENLSTRLSGSDATQTGAANSSPVRPDYGFLSSEITALENQLGEASRQFDIATGKLEAIAAKASQPETTVDRAPADCVVASVPETSFARVFARHLTPWAAALVLSSALILGYFVYKEVSQSFQPELAARTKLIGTVANYNVQRAVNAGVPLEQLTGTEKYFDDLLRNFPEISYFGVATGRIVYEAGKRQKFGFAPERSRKNVPTFPITSNGEQIGYIIVDASSEYFALQFRDVLLDLGVVVLVVILLAFQIIVVVMSRALTAPFTRLQHLVASQAAGDFSNALASKGSGIIERLSDYISQRADDLHKAFTEISLSSPPGPVKSTLRTAAQRYNLKTGRPNILQFSFLNDVRLPLFLFAAADELPLAFFPLFSRAADNPFTWLDQAVVISLPLAGYLLAISFGSPFARALAERFGHRKLLLMAVLPTFLAHLGLYSSTNIVEIIAYRSVAGLGYAIATLACQDYVLDVVPREHRNQSLGLFTAALFSGVFAGTALGGVLADRLGQDTVFAISAGLVLISGLLAYGLLPARAPGPGSPADQPKDYMPPIWQPLRNLRFAALVFGIAIPANVLLQAFISFLAALQLDALGATPADIGRTLMTCFLAIVLVGPVAPRLFAGRLEASHVALIGSILSGFALWLVVAWPVEWSMVVAVTISGISLGLTRDSQVAIAMEIAETELVHLGSAAVLGSLRTLERLGSIAGLVAVALASSYAGYLGAIGIIAVWILVGAGGFALMMASRNITSRFQRTGESPPVDTD